MKTLLIIAMLVASPALGQTARDIDSHVREHHSIDLPAPKIDPSKRPETVLRSGWYQRPDGSYVCLCSKPGWVFYGQVDPADGGVTVTQYPTNDPHADATLVGQTLLPDRVVAQPGTE